MIISKCNLFFSINFLTRRTKMVTNHWHSSKRFCVASEIAAFSSTVLLNEFPRSSPFKNTRRRNRDDPGVRSGIFRLHGWSVRLLKTLSTNCLQTSPEETQELWTLTLPCSSFLFKRKAWLNISPGDL